MLTLHSFSFLRYNRSRTRVAPFPEYIELLRRYCAIAREQWAYETAAALEAVAEAASLPDAALPWSALPTSRSLSSCVGILKSVRERLRA